MSSRRVVAVLLTLFGFSTAAWALQPGQVTAVFEGDVRLVLDSNAPCDGPVRALLPVRVTNVSGGFLNGVTASLGNFGDGFDLQAGDNPDRLVGSLDNGSSRVVTWLLDYPCTINASRSLELVLGDALPGKLTQSLDVSTASTIAAIAGGAINTQSIGAGAATGQVINLDVAYSFGAATTGDIYALHPAGNPGFDASCHQVIGSEVLSSGVNAIPAAALDRFRFAATGNQPGSGHTMSMRYFLRYLCEGTSNTALPYATLNSGASNRKYSGNWGDCNTPTSCDQAFPTPTQNATLSISATPETVQFPGQSVVIKVLLDNPGDFAIFVDEILLQFPPELGFSSFATSLDCPGAVGEGESTSFPLEGDTGELRFVADRGNSAAEYLRYLLPANGTLQLCVRANVAGSSASLVSASARIGQVVLAQADLVIERDFSIFADGFESVEIGLR